MLSARGEGGKGGSVGGGAPTGQRQQVGNSGGEQAKGRAEGDA